MRLPLLAGACSLLLTACGGAVSEDPVASSAPSVAADLPGGDAAEAETDRCTSPAGFSVDFPAGWSVNSGEVLPWCSRFSAEPFTVPRDSDARIADISLRVRPASGRPAPWPGETARRTVVVSGDTAIRVEQTAGPGFYPEGTLITTYVVDLDPGDTEDAEGTVLVADTVGLPGFDYLRNVEVLDAMMASLTLAPANLA